MSNEQTGKLMDLVNDAIAGNESDCDCMECISRLSAVIVGAIESKYRIEPLENTVEEEKA